MRKRERQRSEGETVGGKSGRRGRDRVKGERREGDERGRVRKETRREMSEAE